MYPETKKTIPKQWFCLRIVRVKGEDDHIVKDFMSGLDGHVAAVLIAYSGYIG